MIPLSVKQARLKAGLIFLTASSLLLLFIRTSWRFQYSSTKNIHNVRGFQLMNFPLIEEKSLSYNASQESEFNTYGGGRNVDVLIVGQARSGTTFLGELFNQNPHFAYVFEPLMEVTQVLQNNIFYENEIQGYREEITSNLDSFFACNFTATEKYFRKFYGSTFWRQSKFLERTTPRAKLQHKFSEFKSNYENLLCSFEHRAIKILTSRLSNLSLLSLQDTIQNAKKKNREVKIIHIVREPRAVVNSWLEYEWIKDYPDKLFYRNVERICEPINQNLQFRKQRPKWMEKNYMFVRFEELVLRTEKIAREIYDFLGIQLHENVLRWIDSRLKKPSGNDLANPYSTKRNASIVINKWKNMSDEKRKIIENACSNALKQL